MNFQFTCRISENTRDNAWLKVHNEPETENLNVLLVMECPGAIRWEHTSEYSQLDNTLKVIVNFTSLVMRRSVTYRIVNTDSRINKKIGSPDRQEILETTNYQEDFDSIWLAWGRRADEAKSFVREIDLERTLRESVCPQVLYLPGYCHPSYLFVHNPPADILAFSEQLSTKRA